MTRKCFVVCVVLVWLAVVSNDRANAQWGQSSRNRGSRTNQSNGFGQFLNGLGKAIDNANANRRRPPGWQYEDGTIEPPPAPLPPPSPSWVDDVTTAVETILDNQTNNNNNNGNWPPYHPPRPVYPQYVEPKPVYTPKTKVKANELPVAKPEPKKEVAVAVLPNLASINGAVITAADIRDTKENAQDHIDHKADDIRADMAEKLGTDADTLPQPPYTKAEVENIKNKLKKGQPVDKDLHSLTSPTSDAENRLLEAGGAFDALKDIADDAKKGRLDPGDISDFGTNFGDMFDSTTGVEDDLDKIATDSFWINLLDKADPGIGGLPTGMGTQVIYVPNMPDGQIVSLGNGTVLVGTGGATDGVVMMTCNAVQAAGLSAGIGPPVPDTDAEPMLSGVLLLNKGDKAVHYNVNSDQFSMTPDYTQALPGGSTWAVEFDRGGSHGKAKYGLTEGTYAFTPTDTGWELYEQPESKVTIDNTDNEFAFNYVLNNKQETVAAGEANEHSNKYPMVIRFDDGTGEERRKMLDQEKYTLAVTPEGTMDLYEPSYVEPPIKMAQVLKAPALSGRSLLQLEGKTHGGLFSGDESPPPKKKSRRGLLSFDE
jgi:hypothetical protein